MRWSELCPAVGDLAARNADASVIEHARTCPRCESLARELGVDLTVSVGAVSQHQARRSDCVSPEVGEVYGLLAPGRDELSIGLVVALEDRDVGVLIVRDEQTPAAGSEMSLAESVIGFPASIATDLGGWVLPEQLDGRLGRLSPEQTPSIAPPPRRSSAPAMHATEGGPLAEAREALAPYFEPARSLRHTDTLGELVVLRQDTLQISTADLAVSADLGEAEVEAIKADRADLLGVVRPQALGGLLQQLRVLFSDKLGERITLALMLEAGQSTFATSHRRNAQEREHSTFGRYVREVHDAVWE